MKNEKSPLSGHDLLEDSPVPTEAPVEDYNDVPSPTPNPSWAMRTSERTTSKPIRFHDDLRLLLSQQRHQRENIQTCYIYFGANVGTSGRIY